MCLLGQVEGDIRSAHECLRVGAVVGKSAIPMLASISRSMPLIVTGRASDHTQLVGERQRSGSIRARGHDRELVATEAGHGVALAD